MKWLHTFDFDQSDALLIRVERLGWRHCFNTWVVLRNHRWRAVFRDRVQRGDSMEGLR